MYEEQRHNNVIMLMQVSGQPNGPHFWTSRNGVIPLCEAKPDRALALFTFPLLYLICRALRAAAGMSTGEQHLVLQQQQLLAS